MVGVAGSIPVAPTTQSLTTRDFLKPREWSAFSGFACGRSISAKAPLDWDPIPALLSLASKSCCPATETGASRDQFDMGSYCGMRPST
jgi:hypothetical protein